MLRAVNGGVATGSRETMLDAFDTKTTPPIERPKENVRENGNNLSEHMKAESTMPMLEKLEECPRCDEVKKWGYDAQICCACGYGDMLGKPKDEARAIDAMASELCATWLTDGFCGPRDGECHGKLAGGRSCVKFAKGCLQAMSSRGMKVVWAFNKEPTEEKKIENRRMAPDPFVDAMERAALAQTNAVSDGEK